MVLYQEGTRLWWVASSERFNEGVKQARGYDRRQFGLGLWYVPGAGGTVSEGGQLFATQEEAAAKLEADLRAEIVRLEAVIRRVRKKE